ncbi:MAG: CDP-glucose 4,6-dehydratase [Bacteroidetes bacterium]|nr:MAG: CDP-glucose 4,6-dehydratase [Bacteroidota bacterium]
MNFKKTFRNKKVFLTGHTGFKGAWMCVWLTLLGARVKGYALKPEKNSLYNLVKSKLKIDSVIADVRDSDRLRKELVSFNPDFVFHFAAQALVRRSYKLPVETFETNVTGTVNVLDALRSLRKKCVCVIVTTDKVYENIETDYAYKETDKLGGYDPYSASKAAAEIVVNSYRLSYFHPEEYKKHKKSVATARAGNVIGGGDFAEDRIMPDIVRALSAKKTLVVRNPDAIRPWQHVLEPLHGYLSLAASMVAKPQKFASAYNFGPKLNDTFTVEALVRLAINNWKSGSYKIVKSKNAPHEAGLLKLSIAKVKKDINWQPKWKSSKAISATVDWYKNIHLQNQNAYDLCEKDIEDYLS